LRESLKGKPTGIQLTSAAARVRRLSPGVVDPDEEAADLSPMAEEALRRTYQITQLGAGFWMELLRLSPERKPEGLDFNKDPLTNSGWIYGRALGATIRSWGDLKNARRGHIWFDSSPLLGPRITSAENLKELTRPGTRDPVLRLLTESAIDEIVNVLRQTVPDDCDDWEGERAGDSRELFRLGLASGALERENRNPQVDSSRHLSKRREAALAFVLEREPETDAPGANSWSLAQRLDVLWKSQGGRDAQWRPLYSFLRPGDVVAITLAASSPKGITYEHEFWGVNWWGVNWEKGVPIAIAIVTARTNWDENGWWGRLGSVLFLDGPATSPQEEAEDLQRLRTAFRFPDPEVKNSARSELALAFGLREPSEEEKGVKWAGDLLPENKTTDDLALERFRLYKKWLKREGADLVSALTDPVPVGFAGPWRTAAKDDLRATLGEFLGSHARSIGYFESRATRPITEGFDYQANLNIERFALTAENIRLGTFFDNPVQSKARASVQRIAPDPLDDVGRLAHKNRATPEEGKRIDAANAHRKLFDLYKRGLPTENSRYKTMTERSAKRATSYLPSITLDPSLELSTKGSTDKLDDKRVFCLWDERDDSKISDQKRNEEEGEEKNSISLFAKGVADRLRGKGASKNLEGKGEEKDSISLFAKGVADRLRGKGAPKNLKGKPEMICAAFPQSEESDLDQATFSRAFRIENLEAEDALIPIDPAGTRLRKAILVSSTKSKSQLLIIMTDDSVAAVDLGSIVWMLMAYETLEPTHVLDPDAHLKFLEQQAQTVRPGNLEDEVEELQQKAFQLLSKCTAPKV
jgi:hypothetical protein